MTAAYSMKTLPFGLQNPIASWLPQTPREPYVNKFRPSPKDNWMSDLRILSRKESGLERHNTEKEDPK